MKAEVSKLVRKARAAIRKRTPAESQQSLLRKVRRQLDLSNRELAQVLDVELDTLLAYLTPEKNKSGAPSAKHRRLPESSRLLLERVLAEQRTTKKGGK